MMDRDNTTFMNTTTQVLSIGANGILKLCVCLVACMMLPSHGTTVSLTSPIYPREIGSESLSALSYPVLLPTGSRGDLP